MLTWFNQHRNNLAASALAAFVGAWLLFVCQTCLAQAAVDHPPVTHAGAGSEKPCHDSPAVNKTDMVQNHCLGLCDCNVMDASLNSVNPVVLKDKPDTDNPDLVAVVMTEPHTPVTHTSNYPIARTPERALFLPIEHYTVLLD